MGGDFTFVSHYDVTPNGPDPLPEVPVPEPGPATSVPVPLVPTDPGKQVGSIVLFIEQTTSHALTLASLEEIAAFAAEYKIDTISPKRGEGTDKWYGTAAELAKEREVVLAKGVGYMPYIYCDCRGFSLEFIKEQCAVLAEVMSVNDHCVCADMEAEWGNEWTAAAVFEETMRPVPGLLYVTTFANPITQGFPVRELAPAVNAWIPQDYSNFLVGCESQQVKAGMSIIQPALDLSSEFGHNLVAINAKVLRGRGHTSLWLWDYAFAKTKPEILTEVIRDFRGE